MNKYFINLFDSIERVTFEAFNVTGSLPRTWISRAKNKEAFINRVETAY